jgi:type I restriction enzyme S subunit
VRLKQVATIQTGITLGKVYGDTALIERPYLRVANVQSGRVELSKITTVRLPPAEAAGATLVAGDVLMTEGGDIDKLGRGCVWHGEISECLHQNHVFAVRTDARTLLPEFLVAVMGSRHGRAYFQTTAKQTTNLAATNSTTLGNLPLWLPTTDVQQQILDWVAVNTAEIDGAAVRAFREVGLLHEYRSRLVADVVTGKIDVREAAAHLPDSSTPSEDEGLLAEAAAESDAADLDDAEAEVIA